MTGRPPLSRRTPGKALDRIITADPHRPVRVIARVVFDDESWWHLEAEVANGTADSHGGWVRRELYVVATAWRP